MAGNNNWGNSSGPQGLNRQAGNANRSPYSAGPSAANVQVKAQCSGDKPYDPIEVGEQVAKDSKFTSSQLRKILSMSVVVKNSIERNIQNDGKLSDQIKQDIQYIRLKLVYQMGRDANLKQGLSNHIINLPDIIKNIGDDKRKYEDFCRLLEAIVAYKKYLGEK